MSKQPKLDPGLNEDGFVRPPGVTPKMHITDPNLAQSYPKLQVIKREEEPGDIPVRVGWLAATGKPGNYKLEFHEYICIIEGTVEEHYHDVGILASMCGSESAINGNRPRTIASVVSWGLWDHCVKPHGDWLRDVVAAAGPDTQFWCAILIPGEPSCQYSSVTREVFVKLCVDVEAVQDKRIELTDLLRNFRTAVPRLDSDVHAHMLLNGNSHPADPAGHESPRGVYEEDHMA